MASAPRWAQKDPAATDTGLFRCGRCGSLFDSQDELRKHEKSAKHQKNFDQQELDQAAGEGMIGDQGEYDQLDGTRYPEVKKH
jgi:hypothetical protein